MRKELSANDGERAAFHATYARRGKRGRRGGWAVLLTEVSFADGRFATDHVWLGAGKTWASLEARPGDRIAFEARVKRYEKGYRGQRAERTGRAWSEVDYKLSYPTRMAVIARTAEAGLGLTASPPL